MSDHISVTDVPSQGYDINALWAWLAADENGEGILSIEVRGGVFPMICSTLDTAVAMQGYAEMTAQKTGRTVRLVRYDTRTVVREIAPPVQ